jgi:lysine 2,3-aminomutase
MKLHFAKVPKPEFVSPTDWNSWTWQLRNSLKSQADFERVFTLSAEERTGFSAGAEVFNIRSTPYYASLAGAGVAANIHDPLRRILMPNALELATPTQAMLDPLGERKNNPVSRIIHRYPDRVLFLITDVCSVYCRYCTRKHFTGQEQAFVKSSEYEQALAYIRNHPGIREVILSGGDPLTVGNAQLERTLFDLRKIEHVEIIRIGSRMPVVCPQRIDTELVQMLRRFKPVFLMAHFNHPRELTEEAATAVELFVDHGIPVMNQMVLLNGVNNHPAIVQALSRRLLYLRAKPYYMFQCDPSRGTDHLRTSIEDSLQIQKELWGNLSGLAMPTLSVDIPDGGGKTTYAPNFETARSAERRSYVGWDGVEADYINPPANRLLKPQDAELYQEEWEALRAGKVPGPISGSSAL